MFVEVKLFATFRETRFDKKELDVPDETLLSDLLKQIKIPLIEVGILLVNGCNTPAEYKLVENDVVSIFPPVAGG